MLDPSDQQAGSGSLTLSPSTLLPSEPPPDDPQLLPVATDIYNYIYDGGGSGRLDNVIRFYKSWVVKSVRAVTKYRVSEGVDGEGNWRERCFFGFARVNLLKVHGCNVLLDFPRRLNVSCP